MGFLDSIYKRSDTYISPWRIYTSEDTNASLLILSGGWGALYAKNDETGEDVKIRMHFFGGGPSIGSPVNIGGSTTDYPSGGVGQVGVRNGHKMWRRDFAGRGWIIQLGANSGFSDGSNSPNGGGLVMIFFGTPPYWHKAVARLWSSSKELLPSAGLGLLAATFYVDD